MSGTPGPTESAVRFAMNSQRRTALSGITILFGKNGCGYRSVSRYRTHVSPVFLQITNERFSRNLFPGAIYGWGIPIQSFFFPESPIASRSKKKCMIDELHRDPLLWYYRQTKIKTVFVYLNMSDARSYLHWLQEKVVSLSGVFPHYLQEKQLVFRASLHF